MNWLTAFIKFSRLHTIIGTTLSASGLYLIALANGGGALHIQELIWALISCLGANIYIVGLNQLMDVDIDRINKPDLPLASGAFSIATGRVIVFVSVLISLTIALWKGRYLMITVLISLLIGTLYSLPPVRLKRFTFWAAACIFTVRGVVVNIFLYLHFGYILNGSESVPPNVWALTAFVFGMSLVIAWFKDIPDMEGDRHFSIATLSLRLGAQRVFNLGRGLLAVCYLGLMAAVLLGVPGVHAPTLIASHIILLGVMWATSRRVVPTDRATIARYYLTVWALFFVEYLVFPIACLLA